MNKQTKTLLGVGAIAIALYLILRPKGQDTKINFKGQPRTMPNSVGDCPTGYFLNAGVCLKKYCVGPGMTDLCTCYDRSCDKCTCPGGPGDMGGVHIVRNTI